ncbi:MAG TPA: tetratricopeptide repeat protein [Thermoanaerobaculia bacterium]|nr:tetratricopeptide repeat protein [Thermoanaerobaculia bacterium]
MSRRTVSTGYSTGEIASLLGLDPPRVRSFVRQGILDPSRGARGEYRFSFQDVVILRAAQGLLAAGISMRRVRRALAHLPEQLPRGRSLSSVRLTAEGAEIVVREGGRSWNPESGQALLDFEVAELAQAAAPLAPRLVRDARRPDRELDADDWFAVACELEATAPGDAREVYRRVLELAPDHLSAHINLGRLLHEDGDLPAAEAHYRRALGLAPGSAVAAFNLGVALEDRGRLEEARWAYRRALEIESHNADACYNLAGVCERLGDRREAVRWLKRYRELGGS